jgi:hypothetical protein
MVVLAHPTSFKAILIVQVARDVSQASSPIHRSIPIQVYEVSPMKRRPLPLQLITLKFKDAISHGEEFLYICRCISPPKRSSDGPPPTPKPTPVVNLRLLLVLPLNPCKFARLHQKRAFRAGESCLSGDGALRSNGGTDGHEEAVMIRLVHTHSQQ